MSYYSLNMKLEEETRVSVKELPFPRAVAGGATALRVEDISTALYPEVLTAVPWMSLF